jgi:hypothetical protein
VRGFYKHIDPLSCPASTKTETRLIEFARAYQRSCPANGVNVFVGVLQAVRSVATDVSLLLTTMLSMAFSTLQLFAVSGRDVARQQIGKPLWDEFEVWLKLQRTQVLDGSKIDRQKIGQGEFKVLLAELKADLATYLQALPEGLVPHKKLADVIAFNKANASAELQHFGQDIFETADTEAGLDDPAYLQALATSRGLASGALNQFFAHDKIDVIIAQTNGPAWLSTLGKGDAFTGPSASQLPAVAGFPHLTVPMGLSAGLPVGLSFIGPKWHDHAVLKAGYAYEQLSKARVTPHLRPTLESK